MDTGLEEQRVCPAGHTDAQVTSWGERESKWGTSQRYRCVPAPGEGRKHFFSVPLTVKEPAPGSPLDASKPPPPCPLHAHHDPDRYTVTRYTTYTTEYGRRVQRYECRLIGATRVAVTTKENDDGTTTVKSRVRPCSHTFSAPIPRNATDPGDSCRDCEVLTPPNAGTEFTTRYNSYPAVVVYSTLKELAQGMSYSEASLKALDAIGHPRKVKRAPKLKPSPASTSTPRPPTPPVRGKARIDKAHWHVSSDMLERFGPLVTERAQHSIAEQEAYDRGHDMPVIYVADELVVNRKHRKTTHSATRQAWAALVVVRVSWEDPSEFRRTPIALADPGGENPDNEPEDDDTAHSNRLVLVRALPSRDELAWQLAFSELPAPDYLIADGGLAIPNAAAAVWGKRTVFVPCLYHASQRIVKNITPEKSVLPAKVLEHARELNRRNLNQGGPAFVKAWFASLLLIAEAESLPLDAVYAVRDKYEPMVMTCARIAQAHPEVPISNAGAEASIKRVKKLTTFRGPMFTNLPRTNLLGDLMVAEDNGAFLDHYAVCDDIRRDIRGRYGWAPRPRILTEPLGALGLRDPMVVKTLLPDARKAHAVIQAEADRQARIARADANPASA